MTAVLIVEDNEVNRELIETVLTAEGFVNESIPNGEGVVEAATTLRADIVLMDINMPEVDGYMALDLLRQDSAAASIPVVAVTGNATEADRKKMTEHGFDEIIVKPFHIEDLVAVVRRLTGGR